MNRPTSRLGLQPRSNIISHDVLGPLSFESSCPPNGAAEYVSDPYVRQLAEFFQCKDKATLAREDRDEQWYQDWIDYQAQHGIYAGLLSPKAYSTRGGQLNLLRFTRFLEVFSYFAPAHAYSLHVSFLGLFPILMSGNETLKREAIGRLEAGGLFAFGVSERDHGSDLLANEFAVTPTNPGGYLAQGSKCFIGNANAACMISILAKKLAPASTGSTKRAPFVLFALRPTDAPAFQNLTKVRTLGIRAAFVGEFEVNGHNFPEEDIISEGRDAWDAVFGTVNLGKFFLGFGAIGICEHAFAEGMEYMHRRQLYGKPVTEMPQIRARSAIAFARLTAMKLFAYRALDYLQAASADDRRYLLFNAVQKARVSTEGVRVVELLSECIGARGFETNTFLESALREAPMIPVLEGSTHINFGLTAQFIGSYFKAGCPTVPYPESVAQSSASADENTYWARADDRNAKTVAFSSCLKSYEPLQREPNVRIFAEQVGAFQRLVTSEEWLGEDSPIDAGKNYALGRCFSIVAYGQLIAENSVIAEIPLPLVSLIFHNLVSDLSVEALSLATLYPSGGEFRQLLARLIAIPEMSTEAYLTVADLIRGKYVSPPAAAP